VIVRLSDFKSNEYKKLIGGARYEPDEENPMLGFRGASRYIAESFRRCFEMECQAMRRVRNELGLTNVEIMVPFVRTLGECAKVIELLAANGLKRGENGLRLIMMCELPSNAILAETILEHFDGFSIGSNDLTQLTLGLDRDFGTRCGRVRRARSGGEGLLRRRSRLPQGRKIRRICGRGLRPSRLRQWLVQEGIESSRSTPTRWSIPGCSCRAKPMRRSRRR